MTESVAIITDSISCLTKGLVEKYKIEIVSIRLTFQGEMIFVKTGNSEEYMCYC